MTHTRSALLAVTLAGGLHAAGGSALAQSSTASGAPTIRAPAAILVAPETGDVVMRRNATQRRPIASTTKLMTALLTLERRKLGETLTAVRYSAVPAESVINLRAGERMSVADLLRGLLLASANDAAATLAARVGGSRAGFVRLMNRRAAQIGLRNTHYANPIGLDAADNYSSAEDLVKLTLILLRNSFFAETVNRPAATLSTGARVRRIVNRNSLVREVPFVAGVKTGHTNKAGYVLVGAASRGGVRMVSAVLGEPSEAARNRDTLALLRFGLSRYRSAPAVAPGRVLARLPIRYQGDDRADVVASRTVALVTRRGERVFLRPAGLPDALTGPVKAGARVGTLLVRLRGRTVARVALVTKSKVPAATLTQRLGDFFGQTWVLLVLALLSACSLQLALLRRRATMRRRERARARDERSTQSA